MTTGKSVCTCPAVGDWLNAIRVAVAISSFVYKLSKPSMYKTFPALKRARLLYVSFNVTGTLILNYVLLETVLVTQD